MVAQCTLNQEKLDEEVRDANHTYKIFSVTLLSMRDICELLIKDYLSRQPFYAVYGRIFTVLDGYFCTVDRQMGSALKSSR